MNRTTTTIISITLSLMMTVSSAPEVWAGGMGYRAEGRDKGKGRIHTFVETQNLASLRTKSSAYRSTLTAPQASQPAVYAAAAAYRDRVAKARRVIEALVRKDGVVSQRKSRGISKTTVSAPVARMHTARVTHSRAFAVMQFASRYLKIVFTIIMAVFSYVFGRSQDVSSTAMWDPIRLELKNDPASSPTPEDSLAVRAGAAQQAAAFIAAVRTEAMLDGFTIPAAYQDSFLNDPMRLRAVPLCYPDNTVGGYLYLMFDKDGYTFALEDMNGRVVKKGPADGRGNRTVGLTKKDVFFDPRKDAYRFSPSVVEVTGPEPAGTNPKKKQTPALDKTDGKTRYREWARPAVPQPSSSGPAPNGEPGTTMLSIKEFLRRFLNTPAMQTGTTTPVTARDTLVNRTVRESIAHSPLLKNRIDTVAVAHVAQMVRSLYDQPAGASDSCLVVLPPLSTGVRQHVMVSVTRGVSRDGAVTFTTKVVPIVNKKLMDEIQKNRADGVQRFLTAIMSSAPDRGILAGFTIDQNDLSLLRSDANRDYRLPLRYPDRSTGGYLHVGFAYDRIVFAIENDRGEVFRKRMLDETSATFEPVGRDQSFSIMNDAFQIDEHLLAAMIADLLDTPNAQRARTAQAYVSVGAVIDTVITGMYRNPALTDVLAAEPQFRTRMQSLMFALCQSTTDGDSVSVYLEQPGVPTSTTGRVPGTQITVYYRDTHKGPAFNYTVVKNNGSLSETRRFPYGTKQSPAYAPATVQMLIRSLTRADLGGFRIADDDEYRAATDTIRGIEKERVYRLSLVRPDGTVGGTIECQYHTARRETKLRMTMENAAGQTLRIKDRGEATEEVEFRGAPLPFGKPDEEKKNSWLPAFFSIDDVKSVVKNHLPTPDVQARKEQLFGQLGAMVHGYELYIKGSGTMLVPGITAFMDPAIGEQTFVLFDRRPEAKARSISIDFIHNTFVLKEDGKVWSRRCIPAEKKRTASPRLLDTEWSYQFNLASMKVAGTEYLPLERLADVIQQAFGYDTPYGRTLVAINDTRILDLARINGARMRQHVAPARGVTEITATWNNGGSVSVAIPAGYAFSSTPAYTTSAAKHYGNVVLPEKGHPVVVVFDWSASIDMPDEVAAAKKALRGFLSALPAGTRVLMTGVDVSNPGKKLTELIVGPETIEAYLSKLGNKGNGVSLLGQTLFNVLAQVDPSSPIVYFTDGYPQSSTIDPEAGFEEYKNKSVQMLLDRKQPIYFLVVGKEHHEFQGVHDLLQQKGSPTWYSAMQNFAELEKPFAGIAADLQQVRIVTDKDERALEVGIANAAGDVLWRKSLGSKRWLDDQYRTAPQWENTMKGSIAYDPVTGEFHADRITVTDPATGQAYALTDVHPYFSTINYEQQHAPVTVVPKFDRQKYLFVFDVSSSMQRTDKYGEILRDAKGRPRCDNLSPIKPQMQEIIRLLSNRTNTTGSSIVGLVKYSDSYEVLWGGDEKEQSAFIDGLKGARTTNGFATMNSVLREVINNGYDVNHIVWVTDGCFQDVKNLTFDLEQYVLRYADPDEHGVARRKISLIGFGEFTAMFDQVHAMTPEELTRTVSDNEVMSIVRMYLLSQVTGGEMLTAETAGTLFDKILNDRFFAEPVAVDTTVVSSITIYGEVNGKPFTTVIPLRDPINTLKEAAALEPAEFLRAVTTMLGARSTGETTERIADIVLAGDPLAMHVPENVMNHPYFQSTYMPILDLFDVTVTALDPKTWRTLHADTEATMVLARKNYSDPDAGGIRKLVAIDGDSPDMLFDPADQDQVRELFLDLLAMKRQGLEHSANTYYDHEVLRVRNAIMQQFLTVETAVLESA